ncbi:hypothetical protein BJ165DRAFT_1527720 [Panaeolus papilionaceus]|nr:hypothetical protein BJ165DRAFT_1527720 [Panaeolus papilionaceus]
MHLRSRIQSQRPPISARHPAPLSAPNQTAATRRQMLRPVSAFLLGQGPLPSASAAERGATYLRNGLDGVDDPAAISLQTNDPSSSSVLVRIPLDGAVSDILVPPTIAYQTFLTQVCEIMGSPPNVTKLAWKTSDDLKAILPRELRTPAQLKSAIQTIVKIQSNPKRFKPIAMVIINLNPKTIPYEEELLLLQDKLRCAVHVRPDCWCYVRPGCKNLDDHIPLGIEELNLWAKKIHVGMGDATGNIPPDCFRWAGDIEKQGHSIILKRRYVPEDHDNYVDNNREELLLASLLRSLDVRYPKLNFPQYRGQLHARGIIYARSLLQVEPTFYLDLGMEQAAIGTLLEEAERALRNHCHAQHLNISHNMKGKVHSRALSFGNSDLESDAAPNSDMSLPI